MKLYHYYQSSASYRIRIAINYKNIPCELITVDLSQREQVGDEYKKHNRHGRVPALEDQGFEFGQSSAILEYLEEKYPTPPLLPHDLKSRAFVRFLSQIIISDMHPVMNNSSLVRYLRTHLNLSEEQVTHWYHTWFKQGFDALESMLNDDKKRLFCFGEHTTFADICLIPQVYNAFRFHFPMDNYPTLLHIYEHCNSLKYFVDAKPENVKLRK